MAILWILFDDFGGGFVSSCTLLNFILRHL